MMKSCEDSCFFDLYQYIFVDLDIGDIDYPASTEFNNPSDRRGYVERALATRNPKVPPMAKALESVKNKQDSDAVATASGTPPPTNFGISRARSSQKEILEAMTERVMGKTDVTHKERMEREDKKIAVLERIAKEQIKESHKTVTVVYKNSGPFGFPIQFVTVDELKEEIVKYCEKEGEQIAGVVIVDLGGRQTLLRYVSQITEEIANNELKVEFKETSNKMYIYLVMS